MSMSTINEYDDLLCDAIAVWGERDQLDMVKEELNELAVAVSHWQRGRIEPETVVDEMVDAMVMIAQLGIILDLPNVDIVFERLLHKKMERLAERIAEAREPQDG